MRVEKDPFWNKTLLQLYQELQAHEGGLSTNEALARLQHFGPNNLEVPHPHIVKQILSRFLNPLTLVLITASAFSAASGDVTGFFIITAIIFFSVTLDFFQQYRAERAVEKLRGTVALHASAIRDGKAHEIPASQVVPGDVITLSAGDLVPADGRKFSCRKKVFSSCFSGYFGDLGKCQGIDLQNRSYDRACRSDGKTFAAAAANCF